MNNMNLKVVVFMLAFTSIIVQEVKAVDLGTLLYSPVERKAVFDLRQTAQGKSDLESLKRYTGVVKREDGEHTVWLNSDVTTKNNELFPKIQDTQILLKGKRLKVGDALDDSTGSQRYLIPQETLQKKLFKERGK